MGNPRTPPVLVAMYITVVLCRDERDSDRAEQAANDAGQLALRMCGDVSQLVQSSGRCILTKLPAPQNGNGSRNGNGRPYAITIYVTELPEDGSRLEPMPGDRVFVLKGIWCDGGWRIINLPRELHGARATRLIGPTPAELEAQRRQSVKQRRMNRYSLTATAAFVFIVCLVGVWGIGHLVFQHEDRWQAVQLERDQVKKQAETKLAAAAVREASITQALRQERELRAKTEQRAEAAETQRKLDNLGRDAISMFLRNEISAGQLRLQEAMDMLHRREDRRGEAMLLLSAGAALCHKANFTAAQARLHEALALIDDFTEDETSLAVDAHAHLAVACRALDRPQEALNHQRRVLQLREREWGTADPRLISILQDLALTAFDLEEFSAAETFCARIMAIRATGDTANSPQAVDDLSLLALSQVSAGRFDEAAPNCRQLLCMTAADKPDHNPLLRRALVQLAQIYIDHAKYPQGLALLERALSIPDEAAEASPQSADNWRLLASLYARERRFDEAERIYTRLIGSRETSTGGDDPVLADDACELAELYEQQTRFGEAEALYKLAMSIREKILGPFHPDVAKCALRLADLYRIQGKSAEADALYALAREIRNRSGGPVK